MLAVQRFVNNRECAILQSGDSSAFYKYVNNRRVSKDGVSPLFNTDGELSVTEPEKASILNQQLSSVFIDDDINLPAMNMRTTAELSSITILNLFGNSCVSSPISLHAVPMAYLQLFYGRCHMNFALPCTLFLNIYR